MARDVVRAHGFRPRGPISGGYRGNLGEANGVDDRGKGTKVLMRSEEGCSQAVGSGRMT